MPFVLLRVYPTGHFSFPYSTRFPFSQALPRYCFTHLKCPRLPALLNALPTCRSQLIVTMKSLSHHLTHCSGQVNATHHLYNHINRCRNTFDKIQHSSFTIKTLSKLETEGNFLKLIKNICRKLTVKINQTLCWDTQSFPTKLRYKATISTPFQYETRIPC